VFKAGDGVDALRVLVQRPCDLVICDEVMPAIGGAQLLDAMHAEPRLRNLPAILMVNAPGNVVVPTDRPVRIITKPIDLPLLTELVEEALLAAAQPSAPDPQAHPAPKSPPKPRTR
jgi:CheY-like chemotaxis protein